jgi:hypothetical protein
VCTVSVECLSGDIEVKRLSLALLIGIGTYIADLAFYGTLEIVMIVTLAYIAMRKD